LELNPSIATALNTAIGYDKASEVAKTAAKNRESVRTVVKRMGLLDDDQLEDYLDVRRMTEPGVPGDE
jgi:fumarate hydratase class II